MWTLFLIITFNANPSSEAVTLGEKSITGGISSHEIGFFRNRVDCQDEVVALTEMAYKLPLTDYVVNYRCFPTRSEPE